MKLNEKILYQVSIPIILVLIFVGIGITCAQTNTGSGKPAGMEIYIGNVSQGSTLGGTVADYQAIIDDNKYADPKSFTDLGVPTASSTPSPTPTPTPRPTVTVEVPIEEDGLGKSLCIQDNTSEVIVEFAFSKAGYGNTFYLFSPYYRYLGYTKGDPKKYGDPLGTTWNLGTFVKGEELIFADRADMGNSNPDDDKIYYTGPGSRNPDKSEHGVITLFNTTGGTYHKYLVSFEDLLNTTKNWKDSEPDYNDVELYVSGNIDICEVEDTYIEEEDDEDDTAAIVPIYQNICQCYTNSTDKHGNIIKVGTGSCVAQFTYATSVDNWIILPKTKGGDSDQPWNEFTASGNTDPIKEYRCQPDIFYVNVSNAPFWTSPFGKGEVGGSQLHWKLGSTWVSSGVCKSNTEFCPGDECTQCSS